MTGFLLNRIIKSFGGSIINAFIIQLATTKAAHFKPTYISAYIASFLVIFIGSLLGTAGAIANINHSPLGAPISIFVMFILGSALYGRLLKHPADGAIGIRKGMLVSLVQMLLAGAILFGLMLFFYIYRLV